ncbi:MAG: ABC transporter ATP-binding protein, partial [Patescibacteria group bacterium]
MEPIIKIKGLSKKYNIAHQRGGYVALRDVLTNVFKNPFRFAKDKTKQAIGIGKKEEFWALKDINLEVNKGEIIGIIGRNGAGKSTLLKILSKITPPTEGEVYLNGRVGSLLEVGTGFHPELTGRENIFLNGAILGMTRREIAKKFDQIVEFSGIEKFLDTPVKYYSSGMYVRLAFSVAAHMEPDILIVDEVLAVGDAEFQKKCLGKMEEVTKNEGRTILLVSHNMGAIERLCNRCILLDNGNIIKEGETKDVIDFYLNSKSNLSSEIIPRNKNSQLGQFTKITILNKENKPSARIPISEPFYIDIEYEICQLVSKKCLFLYFFYQGELLLVSLESDENGQPKDYQPGKYKTRVTIPPFLFQLGFLSFDVTIQNMQQQFVDAVRKIN